jgi:hypothetical protein
MEMNRICPQDQRLATDADERVTMVMAFLALARTKVIGNLSLPRCSGPLRTES